jgi:hypothetical protein
MKGPFDQEPNRTALTARLVLDPGYPILKVIHYKNDHGWAFICGTADNEKYSRMCPRRKLLNATQVSLS